MPFIKTNMGTIERVPFGTRIDPSIRIPDAPTIGPPQLVKTRFVACKNCPRCGVGWVGLVKEYTKRLSRVYCDVCGPMVFASHIQYPQRRRLRGVGGKSEKRRPADAATKLALRLRAAGLGSWGLSAGVHFGSGSCRVVNRFRMNGETVSRKEAEKRGWVRFGRQYEAANNGFISWQTFRIQRLVSGVEHQVEEWYHPGGEKVGPWLPVSP